MESVWSYLEMRIWDWYTIDGESYQTPTASVPANYDIPFVNISITSNTSATFTFGSPTTTPGSYGGSIAGTGSFNDPDFVINVSTGTYTQTNFIPGQVYNLRIRAYSGTNATGTYGEYFYKTFVMPKNADVAGVTSTVSKTTSPTTGSGIGSSTAEPDSSADAGGSTSAAPTGSSYATSGVRTVQRSLLTVTNKFNDREKYSVVEKDTEISTAYSHYSFGAGFFFDSVTKTPLSAGGLGFFTSNNGMTGYFVQIQTDSSTTDTKQRSVNILKVVNGVVKQLEDSQGGDSGKLYGGVIHASSYKLDVKVNRTSTATVIDLYINNFKISAADVYSTSSTAPAIDKAIPVTSKIAVFAQLNKISFDYVYAVPLTEAQFKTGLISDIYTGHYGSTLLNFAYGEKLINNIGAPVLKNAFIEEFGTVARELRRVKVNYAQTAGIPRYATVGVNKFASVLGSKFSNHGAEVFVLNNAGTFIPLQSGAYSFFIIGDFVSINGQHEYTESTTNEFTTLEPAIFESTWIQNQSDAKSLFNWIKNQWSNQQSSVSIEVFGNPAIEPGDIISISYAKNNLDGTQKFVVTNVTNQFEGGLSTTVTARSIYS
jgi:hypothetical protein